MAQYIDKDALVAEINKRMSRICGDDFYAEVKRGLYNSLIIYLNTHEVKEVDLEKEMIKYFETMKVQEYENIYEPTFNMIAKHFFELGIAVSNKAQKRRRSMTDKEKKRLQEIQNVPVDEEKLRNDRRNTV